MPVCPVLLNTEDAAAAAAGFSTFCDALPLKYQTGADSGSARRQKGCKS